MWLHGWGYRPVQRVLLQLIEFNTAMSAMHWHRLMADNPEGSEKHEFAKRIVFFQKEVGLRKRFLESSPRTYAIPEQQVDRWHNLRETIQAIKNTLNPKNLIP